MQPAATCIYLLGHSGTSLPTTHINCTDDPFNALAAHNAGEFRETKNAAGQWSLMLLVYVPAERGIDMAHLVQHWRDQRRTLQHRMTYGIGMAAKLMLLCFVNGEQLRAAKGSDKQSEHLLQKVLTKIEANQSAEITHEAVRQRVERYLQTPRTVYEARNGPSGGDWLKELNTLKRRHSDTVCFSQPPPPDEPEQPPVSAKRAKKSMNVVNGLVSLQQSAVFNDTVLAPSAQTLMTNNTSSTATSGAARRRQRNLLFSARGTVDPRTLSLYGDALCVNMSSNNTLANMRVVGGEHDRRCVCGTPRLSDDELVSVLLTPDSEPVSAHRCNACGRLSATYERYCIDSSRANRSLKAAPKDKPDNARSAAAGSDEVSASNDSLDMFVQTLLVSFNETSQSTPVSPKPRTPKKVPAPTNSRARKRLFGVTPADVPTHVEQPEADTMFVFGNRAVRCRHASLTEVSLSNTDTKVIADMIKA